VSDLEKSVGISHSTILTLIGFLQKEPETVSLLWTDSQRGEKAKREFVVPRQ